MMRIAIKLFLLAAVALTAASCSPRISGTVRLVDANLQPIPVAKEAPEGTVVNMINTTASLEQASQSVTVNNEGTFESPKDSLLPGLYKVEASRLGYITETLTVEVSRFFGKSVDIKLKQIAEGKQKSINSLKSDEDKIVNPGEVNLQPPTL
jgi:hypothetical protein